MRKTLLLITLLFCILGVVLVWAKHSDVVNKIPINTAEKVPFTIDEDRSTVQYDYGKSANVSSWQNTVQQEKLSAEKARIAKAIELKNINAQDDGLITDIQETGDDCSDPFIIS